MMRRPKHSKIEVIVPEEEERLTDGILGMEFCLSPFTSKQCTRNIYCFQQLKQLKLICSK
jgi:hypothetical protein